MAALPKDHPVTSGGAVILRDPAFLRVLVELSLVLGLFHLYGIEQSRGLLALTPLVLGGFVLHAALPLRLRMPTFVVLSLAGYALLFPGVAWLALLGIGLVLIGICHLPVAWPVRFLLLAASGATLTAMRGHWIDAPWAAPVLPIMGSIFMFRLVLYVYDLRTESRPLGTWERLAYFFLLPNALFPLFPIIDPKAFRRGWYARADTLIYAKGVRWMTRGVVHLLLYRLIYMNFTPPVDGVHDLGGVVLSMVSSYALYLRVSGIFHIIVGMLGLFGFDLPETHHHYFLASGFNDLWRRINIYWKDFMMKIVYYPIFIRMRRSSPGRALVVATLAVFMLSWWLHSYQMFWIRGRFPLTEVDAIFWVLFAVAVLINSEMQRRHGTSRSLRPRTVGVREAAVTALKTTAMFSFMCVLWSFWTGGTLSGFAELCGRAVQGPASQFAWLGAGLAGLVLVGIVHQVVIAPRWTALTAGLSSGARSAWSMSLLLGLGVLGSPALIGHADDPWLASIRAEQLNEHDQGLLLRGYYEELLEGEGEEVHDRGLGGLAELAAAKPSHWVRLNETDALVPAPVPMLERVLRPHLDMEFLETRLRTNAYGLRDREYDIVKPAGTYRFAVLGASIEMGSGVENEQIFEALTETQLNALNTGTTYERYELLNFAVNGYPSLVQVPLLQSVVRHFEPDTLLFFAHTVDARVLHPYVKRMLLEGVELPPSLNQIVKARRNARRAEKRAERIAAADVNDEVPTGTGEADDIVPDAGDSIDAGDVIDPGDAGVDDDEPAVPEDDGQDGAPPDQDEWLYQQSLLSWTYTRMVELCRGFGIRPVWVYLQHPPNQTPGLRNRGRDLRRLAEEAGFLTIVLDGDAIYPQDDWQRYTLRPWDNHPNAEGHRRIAEALTRALLEHEDVLHLGLTRTPVARAEIER